jgi:hypothetical protein
VSGSFTPGIFRKNLNFKIGGYGHMNSRIKDIPNYSNLDILFVGSSHSYRGFDTRIFKKMNFKVFNLGSSSQSPIQQELLLDQYVNLLNPKLVVFEVFPKIMESDGVESALDVLANDKIDYKSLRMCCKTNNIKAYNTLIYGYYRQLFNLNANFTESKIKNDDAYVDGGFVERQVSFYKSSVKTNIKKISYQLNDLQLSTFKTILKSLNDKNIRYVLVQAPLTQNFYARYTNNEYVDSVYHSLGAYYNFNKLLSLKDSLFYDAHHLNQNGVNVFNEKFIEVLKQDHLLNQ